MCVSLAKVCAWFHVKCAKIMYRHGLFFTKEHQVDGTVSEEFDKEMCATSSMHTHIFVYAIQSLVHVWSTFVSSFQSY